MDNFLHVKTFVQVARYGSFSDAARDLQIAPSVVAKRIAQLERVLDTRLFERTTRSVKLTEAGERLLVKAGVLVTSFDDLLSSVERDESKLAGHIRVMAPTTLTMMYLNQVFCAFLGEHDQITLEIALMNHSVNPAEQGFDIAISGRSASYEGVVDVPLCPVDTVLCASPVYLEQHGQPSHPRELSDHACLVFVPSGLTWRFQSTRGIVNVDVRARFLADDNMTLLRAALSGLGIAALPGYMAQKALEAGELVLLLDKFPLQETWFKAYVPKRKRHVARVAALIDWLAQAMATREWMRSMTTEMTISRAPSVR